MSATTDRREHQHLRRPQTHRPETPPSPHWTVRALAGVGILMVVNGAAFFVPLVIDAPYAFSDNGARWQFQVFHVVYLAALVVLALVVPGLGRFQGTAGRQLPAWLPLALTALIPLQAGTVFAQAFIVPFLAEVAPATLDVEDGGVFAIAMGAAWVLWSLTLVTLGVIGARRRVVPVVAAILLVLGALVIPVFGSPGTVLIGAALALWAARVLRTAATAGESTGDALPVGAVRP